MTHWTNRSQTLRHSIRLVVIAPLAVALAFAASNEVDAQPSWEYSPYRIHVWLTTGPAAELNEPMHARMARELTRRAETMIGACWEVQVEDPPAPLAADVAFDLTLISAEDLEQHAAETLLNDDKIFLMNIGANAREYVVQVREADCRTRHFGPVINRRVRQADHLVLSAFSALVDAFAPLVRIESGEERQLTTRLRAGGLIMDEDSPAFIATGDILQPIVRRNDRLGKPTRIDVVDWTFLEVTTRNETNPNLLDCYVHSAMRSPIRGRGGSRREQYALGIRPTQDTTRLDVQAQVGSKDTPYPLPGLEVYSKRPSTDPIPQTPEEKLAEAKNNPAELLGHTDWRGSIDIGREDLPLRIVYLKNGGQLLRRLPIVPGLSPILTTDVPDDDPRLQAESFIRGFHGQIMDLVAQRKILEFRIRKRIADREVEEAEKLITELRGLPARNDMARELDKGISRQIKSPNRYVQASIDTMYGDTRTMLNTYLSPDLPDRLTAELNQVASRTPPRTD